MCSGLWSPGHGWEEEATKWTGELLLLAGQLQAVHVLEGSTCLIMGVQKVDFYLAVSDHLRVEGEHHGAEVAGNRVGQIEVGLSIKHVTLEGEL